MFDLKVGFANLIKNILLSGTTDNNSFKEIICTHIFFYLVIKLINFLRFLNAYI